MAHPRVSRGFRPLFVGFSPLSVLPHHNAGGGYTVRNVARCWGYETGLLLDQKLPDEIPYNEYYEYYGPEFQLHIQPSNMENLNSTQYLDKIQASLFETLRHVSAAPGVQYSTRIPDSVHAALEETEVRYGAVRCGTAAVRLRCLAFSNRFRTALPWN